MVSIIQFALFMCTLDMLSVLAVFEVETITDLDVAAITKQRLLFYHPMSETYLFVSNDEWKKDNIVESHRYQYETRNLFKLEKLGERIYRILNMDYKRWLFISNDRKGYNHVLEAHPYSAEKRNAFRVTAARNQPVGHYLITNTEYGLTLFVSKDEKQGDYIVEANKIDWNGNMASDEMQKYVFVLQGIKGVMGSQNDVFNDDFSDQQSINWVFAIVVVLIIGSCLLVAIKKIFGEDKLSKFR